MTRLCHVCGDDEDAHHEFTPIIPPKGCVCDPREWGNPLKIPAICAKYEGEVAEGDLCEKCEHEKACHGAD
jgi:hypothetical protein